MIHSIYNKRWTGVTVVLIFFLRLVFCMYELGKHKQGIWNEIGIQRFNWVYMDYKR